MTYFGFHALFLLPPLALLVWRRIRGGEPAGHWLPQISALALIALLYTTPWDNYLVRRGVWSYSVDRVAGTIGYVPVEEYLFFLLQPFLVGLLFLEFERCTAEADRPFRGARRLGALTWLFATGAGGLLLREEAGTYMGLILVWAGPVLAAQWAWAGRAFMRRLAPLAATVAAASAYLWIADRIAIAVGIWHISSALTTGLQLFGLPLEEALFFFLTVLLVAQGLILFRYPPPFPGSTTPDRASRDAP